MVVTASAVRVDLVVDRAEIPTRQTFPTLDDSTGGLPGNDGSQVAAEQCAATSAGAELLVDDRPVPLTVEQSALTFPPGAAGLRTGRLVCRLAAPVDDLIGARVADPP